MSVFLLDPLELKIYNNFKANLSGNKILLCLSGGQDSVCLLHILNNIKNKMNLELLALHVHHGELKQNKIQNEYRDLAKKFSKNICDRLGVELISIQLDGGSQSEQDLRRGRKLAIDNIKLEAGIDYVVSGHHYDDLFETRLIRLIRGTGPQGLLSMTDLDSKNRIWRPLLKIKKAEIESYTAKTKTLFIEDPSNLNTQYLRNWVRHIFLPSLNDRNPGSIGAFSRSLDQLSEFIADYSNTLELKSYLLIDGNINRPKLLGLSEAKVAQLIAKFFLLKNINNFTRHHIAEIMKRLDKGPLEQTFKLLGKKWKIDADSVSVLR